MKLRYLSAAALTLGLFAAQPVMAAAPTTADPAAKPSQPIPHKPKPKKKKKPAAVAPAPADSTKTQ